MAAAGMGGNSASSGFWAIVAPPASLMARIPVAPSLPEPLKTTAMARDPYVPATDSNSRSIDGREKCTSCECANWIFPGPTSKCSSGGAMYTVPGSMISLCSACFTGRRVDRPKRLAIQLLCVGDRCWTTTMLLGKLRGKLRNTCESAFNPPAEVPIATTSNRRLA